MKKLDTTEIVVGAVFVALMAIGANISIWFPFLAVPIGGVSVPISLQTFFAIMAGLMLGKRLATYSMITYLLIGIAGVPVFANMKAGPFILFSYTGGFLISFIFVGLICGWIAEKSQSSSIYKYSFAAFSGLVVNYLIGVSYMYISMNTWLNLNISYSAAWSAMIPFLIKDIILTFVAAIFMYRIISRIPSIPSRLSKS